MANEAQPSIHRQRRGWYVLWVSLLLAGLAFLAVWDIPATKGVGHVSFTFKTRFPPGVQADYWAGPHGQWRGGSVTYQGTAQGPADPSQFFTLPLVRIDVGLRRFHLGYVPRCTTDQIVVRFRAPQEADRYLSYDLAPDFRQGFIGPHLRMALRIPLSWEKLSKDAQHPTPLQ